MKGKARAFKVQKDELALFCVAALRIIQTACVKAKGMKGL